MNGARLGRWLALGGHLGLFIVLMAKITGLGPPSTTPTVVRLLLQVGPLMFALRGLLHGRRYTHVWSAYLALYYLLLGVDGMAAGEVLWGGATTVLALALFSGCYLYVRGPSQARHG